MINRRDALKQLGSSFIGLSLLNTNLFANTNNLEFVSQRPPFDKRNFVSEAVEATISSVRKNIADAELAWMFENCYPNTLDTTVHYKTIDGKPDTFVITGDIEAM